MDITSREWSACLFPHSHASERGIKRVLSFFDTLAVCRPWHMEDRFSIPSEWGLEVFHPPAHLKPIAGLPSLLSEYKDWMRQHRDRGYASALASIRGYERGEDATWEIRRSLRGAGEGGERSEPLATRFHLLLHLARENEERLREADEALRLLKGKGSPLRDAVDEGEPQGLLDDISGFDPGPEIDEEVVRMISEAWHGLFGGMLAANTSLLTLSRPFFETISAMWSEHLSEEGEVGTIGFPWPDLSSVDAGRFASERGALDQDQRLRGFREAVKTMGGSRVGWMKVLSDLARGLELNPPWGGEGMLRFRLRYLAPHAGAAARMKSLGFLSGRLLFLLEGPCDG